MKKVQSSKFKVQSYKKPLLFLALCLLLLFALLFIALPGRKVYSSAQNLLAHTYSLKEAAAQKDLIKVKEELPLLDQAALRLQADLKSFSWTRFLPFFGQYYRDSEHLLRALRLGVEVGGVIVEATTPFADVLGLRVEEEAVGTKLTAEQKLVAVVEVMPAVAEHLDEIVPQLSLIGQELSSIKPQRYPESFKGIKVRSLLTQAKEILGQVETWGPDLKETLTLLPQVLGKPNPKTYVAIFQNDKELRPTGGFWTAYALMKVEGGKITDITSEDTYQLEDRIAAVTPAPAVYRRDLKIDRWFARDANLSPDFKVSALKFFEFWKKARGVPQNISGIFALDTFFVRDLLEVLGPVQVSGFAEPFTSENIVYQLELYATRVLISQPGRKDFIGVLMHDILDKALKAPKEDWPKLAKIALSSAAEKHVLFHFFDPQVQGLTEKYNLGGRIIDFEGDYLHINDANFAGAKANLYISEAVRQLVSKAVDGKWVSEVTIEYENPEPYDGWLNGPYRDYVRIYVPQGSKLISSSGSIYPVETFEDLGKTVFAGFIVCLPQNQTSITFKYELPEGVIKDDQYNLLIQKQPGTDRNQYEISLDGKKVEEFELDRDRVVELK